ncbi:hypothetical protein [Streptomyces sp. NRRL S-920]|uniref:hypothetical protein n=1 Tax=Streptomyces sp. NRRL S-920 TaxID=1463921 RepID=UPI0004C4CFFE|nr:hypothetical protein [Streptomyces sp. NRRL S-920]
MTFPEHNATADTRALVLEMFKGNVPCIVSMGDPPCHRTAVCVAYFRHLPTGDCDGQPPAPLCPEHRRNLELSLQPFWRAWLNADPILCDACGEEITVDRIEAIT